MENSKKLSPGTLILFGTAVFAMHFGASCMLWPVTWGQQSGSSVYGAMVGIFITAILFVYCAYVAMVRGEGSFYQLAARINKKFAFVFGGLTVAVLGPLFVIPRMSAAAWDAMVRVFNITAEPLLVIFIFQAIYYLIAYWFMFNQSDILDKIGKYLVPVLVITVVAVVVKSLMSPMSEMIPKQYSESGFMYGFINGYQTMDLPAALIYGGVIIANLKAVGQVGKALTKNLLIVCGLGLAMLTCTHLLQMLVGALTGALFLDVSYAKLYATVIMQLWGVVGGTLFNIALLFAALTSAVGLGAGAAAYFVEASEGKWDYKKLSIIILAVSTIIACIGLSTIVVWTAPILSLIYPACIALAIGYIIFGNRNIGTIGGATVVAFGWGVIDCLVGYAGLMHIDTTGFMAVYNTVPLASLGLGWIIPTLIGGIVGYYMFDKKEDSVKNITG